MTKLIKIVAPLIFLMCSGQLQAKTHHTEKLKINTQYTNCDSTNAKPCLFQDLPMQNYRISALGLPISGSSQPGENTSDWATIVAPANGRLVYDVDLREESHGYNNLQPITLVGTNNDINFGDSIKLILLKEFLWLHHLKAYSAIENVQVKQISAPVTPTTVPVKKPTSELEVVHRLHLGAIKYYRLNFDDHDVAPSANAVSEFIKIVKQADREGAWIHFHCREGEGRTTEAMVMYDVLHNQKNLPLETIINDEMQSNPHYNFKKDTNIMAFLQTFYNENAKQDRSHT